jgi:uncharacterized membrane protein YgcG
MKGAWIPFLIFLGVSLVVYRWLDKLLHPRPGRRMAAAVSISTATPASSGWSFANWFSSSSTDSSGNPTDSGGWDSSGGSDSGGGGGDGGGGGGD